MWNDYKHLFGPFACDDASDEGYVKLPSTLTRLFQFQFHVSNVGPVTIFVPPRKRANTHLNNASDEGVLRALACFVSASHVIQMGGCPDGWVFSALPFRYGAPQVWLRTDYDYRLEFCEMDADAESCSALFKGGGASAQTPKPVKAQCAG